MCQDFFYGFNTSCPTCSPTLNASLLTDSYFPPSITISQHQNITSAPRLTPQQPHTPSSPPTSPSSKRNSAHTSLKVTTPLRRALSHIVVLHRTTSSSSSSSSSSAVRTSVSAHDATLRPTHSTTMSSSSSSNPDSRSSSRSSRTTEGEPRSPYEALFPHLVGRL